MRTKSFTEACAANDPFASVLLAKYRASAGRPGFIDRAGINSVRWLILLGCFFVLPNDNASAQEGLSDFGPQELVQARKELAKTKEALAKAQQKIVKAEIEAKSKQKKATAVRGRSSFGLTPGSGEYVPASPTHDSWRGYAPQASGTLRQEIQLGVQKLKTADDVIAKDAAKDELAETLQRYFDQDMQQREQSISKLLLRVQKLKAQLAKRQAAKESILKLQLQVLENEAAGLGFFGTTNAIPRAVYVSPNVPKYTTYPNTPQASVGAPIGPPLSPQVPQTVDIIVADPLFSVDPEGVPTPTNPPNPRSTPLR